MTDPNSPYAPPPEGSTPQGSSYTPPPPTGPIGQVRGTGVTMLLMLVTCGIYGLFYYYKTHEEMKAHTGRGLGGGVALILSIVFGLALAYTMPSEVEQMYVARGKPSPVSWKTGLWMFPGIFLIVGPIVWFVKTNGALNEYWRSVGAQG